MGCPGPSVRVEAWSTQAAGVLNVVAPQKWKGEEGVEVENPMGGK